MLPRTESRIANLLILTIWFGLAYGLLEAIQLLLLYDFTHYLMWRNGVNSEILWVAPVVDTGLFLLAGAAMWILFLLLGRAREGKAWTTAFTFFVFIASLGLFSTSLAIQEWGCLALAVGVTVQAYRWASKKFRIDFFRRTLVPLVVVAIVAGTAGGVWPKWHERQFLASLPPAKPGSPNVLIVVLDTLRADHMSLYGYPRNTTPNIAKLASEGMLFEKGFSGSTNSPPSHLGLMSGLDPGDWYAGVLHNRFHPLLSETLATQGYATGAFIANDEWVIPQIGLGAGFARFDVYFSNAYDKVYRTFYGKTLIYLYRWWGGYYDQPGRKRAPEVNRELLEWVEKSRAMNRPFFALLNYFDTHDPRIVPEPYATKFSPRVTKKNLLALYSWRCRIPANLCQFKELTPEERQLLVDAYDGSMAYLDHWIGQLENELAEKGVLDNTVIIVLGDHGESLGENNVWGHILPVMREEITHVPLIVRYPPRAPAGTRITYPASFLQVPATVAEIVGLSSDSPFHRRSLLQDWQDPGGPVLVESEGNYTVASGKWQLIVYKPGPAKSYEGGAKVQLYDLETDSYEKTNLAGRTETAAIEAELRQQLAILVKQFNAEHAGSFYR